MSQSTDVLDYIQTGRSITSWQAIEMLGATRLGAIIFDLKAKGHNIESKLITVKNRNGKKVQVSQYTLGEEK